MSIHKINDLVMHCREGLSSIVGKKEMGGRDYFLVRAKRNFSETIYVPIDTCQSIIRSIMTQDEAHELLLFISNIKKEFNSNTKQRRDAFKRYLNSGDVKDMAYLFAQKRCYCLEPDNVRLGPSDLDMLNYASDFLLDEFAICYNVDREKISDYIELRLKTI